MTETTLTLRHCDRCGHDIPEQVWLPGGTDHAVLVNDGRGLTVEVVDVDATGLAHIRATENTTMTTCATLNRVQPCPECRQGKCDNCDGTTWDVEADAPTGCPCAQQGHQRGHQ